MSAPIKAILILAALGVVVYWIYSSRGKTITGGYKYSPTFNVARGGMAQLGNA